MKPEISPDVQQAVAMQHHLTVAVCPEIWRPVIDTNKVPFTQLVNKSRSKSEMTDSEVIMCPCE